MASGSAGPTRFIILGGYLGAGKTTLAVSLARELREKRGKSVAIITNDQGNVLVDTEFVKDAGFDVRDVMGGCFCSNFNQFIKSARSLVQMGRPDVIIAEPIGTSTNILASVIVPMKTMYPDEFEVAPLCVVVDGTRASELVAQPGQFGLGGARLIPRHQVQEAEYVLVSKADRLPDPEIESAVGAVKKTVPDAEVVAYSSVTGLNIGRIADLMATGDTSKKVPLGADNRLFAAEKASLGWYNANATIHAADRADLYAFITSVLRKVSARFGSEAIAHVKLLVESREVAVRMSLVMDSLQTDGIRGGRYLKGVGRLVLNARILAMPQELKAALSGAVRSAAEEAGIELDELSEVCFTPKPETPSHMQSPRPQ